MKIAIAVFVLIALALAIYGKWASDHDPNPDNIAGTFPLIGAVLSLAAAVVLTIGWGAYRLFTS